MNGTSLMNVSDGCPILTCLSLKLNYFYVISTVSMLLVIIIINYEFCHIALYKMNCIVVLLLNNNNNALKRNKYMYMVYYISLNLMDIGL